MHPAVWFKDEETTFQREGFCPKSPYFLEERLRVWDTRIYKENH